LLFPSKSKRIDRHLIAPPPPPAPPGLLLVRYYGQHSCMWVREEECELPPPDEGEHLRQLRAAGRQQHQ
jgi:hypothetical protein